MTDLKNAKHNFDTQHFGIEITKINTEIKELTWAGGLFRFEFFRQVHSEPKKYAEIVQSFLTEDELTEQQKVIMILMMQKLPLNDYVKFLDSLIQMFEEEKITHTVMRWAVLPGYEWNTLLAEGYKDSGVILVINRLIKLEIVEKELKSYIEEEILTGRAKKQVQFLRNSGQIR